MVSAHAQVIRDGDYDEITTKWDIGDIRKGYTKYGLFKELAYAGGISGNGGTISNSYNTVLGGEKDEFSDNHTVEGGYEIFKPYELSVTRVVSVVAVIIGVVVSVIGCVVAYFTAGVGIGVAIALIGAAVSYGSFGGLFAKEIYPHENISRMSWDKFEWTDNINFKDVHREDKFGYFVYGEDYKLAFDNSGLSEKYTPYFDGVSYNNTTSNCKTITGSVYVPVPNEIDFVHGLTLKKFGIPFPHSADDDVKSINGEAWKENTDIHKELKAFIDFESKTEAIAYKTEEDDAGNPFKVYEIYSASGLNWVRELFPLQKVL